MPTTEKRAATMAKRAATPPAPPPTVEGLRATLAEIAARRDADAARLREIAAERRTHALAAHEGDTEARAIVGALNIEAGQLVAAVDLTHDAQREAERLLVLAEAAENAQHHRQQRAEATRVAHLLDRLHAEIDAGLKAAAAGLAQRETLLRELTAADPERGARLLSRRRAHITAALAAAGLLAQAGIPGPALAARTPLAASTGAMLGDLLGVPRPVPQPPKPEVAPVPLAVKEEAEDGWTRAGGGRG